MNIRWTIVVCFCLFCFPASVLKAQCPDIFDGFGNPSANPVFVSCNGGSYTVFIQSNVTITNYVIDWGDGSPNTTGASLVPPNFVSHTYAATVDTFNITVTELSSGCVITGLVVLEEPVNASIQIPIGGVTQICAPASIDFINSSTDVSPTTTFTWDFGDGSPQLTFDASNAGQTVTHTYNRNTVNCNTIVTLTAENYCSFGNPTQAQFAPIQVYDIDDALINASAQLLCYPDTVVSFQNATNKNCEPQGNVAQRYEYWNFGDYWGLGYDSIINWQPFDPPARPGYTLAYPGIGTYQVMMIDSNQCGQDTAYFTVNIVPPPTAGITSNRDTICAGEQVTFINGSIGGANSFRWNFDRGAGWQNLNGNNKTRTYPNPGNYTVGLAVTINGGSPACADTDYVDLYVSPSPVASFTMSGNQGCDSLEVSFTDQSTNTVAWSWNFGNGNTSNVQNPPNQSFVGVGNYTVQLEVTHPNGCTDQTSQQVQIFQTPQADFQPNNVCQLSQAQFTDLSTHFPGDPIVNWDWDFGDGGTSTQQNPNHLYSTSGTYNFQLIVATAQCADTLNDTVVVEPKPVAGFTVNDSSGCSPLPVTYTNTSTGAVNYNWSFGDGTTSNATSPGHTFLNANLTDTSYTTVLIAETTFGCRDTAEFTLDVFGIPQAAYTSNATPSCAPYAVQFTNGSQGAVSYQWDFGDSTGSSLTNPSHTFNNQTLFITQYPVALIAQSVRGCRDTAIQNVTIYPEPIFPFSTIPDSGCSPLSVTFPALIGAATYQWDFGDGTSTTGQSPTHIFTNNTTNNQTFNVQLIATSSFGCSDTTFEDVIVYPSPTASFVLSEDTGCAPLVVTLQNLSSGASSYLWEFGNGDTSTSGVPVLPYTYQNSGPAVQNNTLKLTVSTVEGCADSLSVPVTIYPEVVATPLTDTAGCHPLSLGLTAQATNATNYAWDFGNGQTASGQSAAFTFTNALVQDTVYPVQVVASSPQGCADTANSQVTVHYQPVAGLSVAPTSGCSPFQIQPNNTTLGVADFLWRFGTGDSSLLSQPLPYTYFNTGTASVNRSLRLYATTTNGCIDSASVPLTIHPEVDINVLTVDTADCHPFSLPLSAQAVNAVQYQWNFGNGNSSTLQSPTETFINNSLSTTAYPVSLIATSAQGCADTGNLQVTVYHRPIASYTASVTTGCAPLSVQWQNNSQGATGHFWRFGNGDTSVLQSPAPYTYLNAGPGIDSPTSSLVVSTGFGCTDSVAIPITVYPEVVITSLTADTAACHPFALPLNTQATNTVQYQWNFGNGNASGLQNPQETFTNTTLGTLAYQAQVIATSALGCADTGNLQVTVYHKPIAMFTASADSGCAPLNIQWQNGSQGATSYLWEFGNADSSIAQHPAPYTYQNAGPNTLTQTPRLTVETPFGCRDTAEYPIRVFPQVTLTNLTADTAGCHPFVLPLSALADNATQYDWDFGNGSTVTSQNPTEVFQNPGLATVIYTSEVIASSVHGCADTGNLQVTVYHKPIADFSVSGNAGCTPYDVNIQNNSQGAGANAWDFGDGTTSVLLQPGQHTYVNTLTNPITPVLSLITTTAFGCADTATEPITIYPEVIAAFTGDTAGCHPFTLPFTNTSIGAGSFQWDLGNGNTSQLVAPTETFLNLGTNTVTYPVQMIASSPFGCSDTATSTITVFHKPVASFALNQTSGCTPLRVDIQNNGAAADFYDWDFGDGNVSNTQAAQLSHTYVITGSVQQQFPLRLITRTIEGCSDTAQQQITVFPPVLADFTGDTAGCSPVNIQFLNQTSGATNYQWDFGNGNGSAQPNPDEIFTYTGTTDTTYNVRLIAISVFGCRDTAQQNIRVFPTPQAVFSASPLTQNFPSSTVNLVNQTIGNWIWDWRFGDGSSSAVRQPGSVTYANPGAYTISLTIRNAYCSDTLTRQVIINPPPPEAAFIGSGEGCAPLTVEFFNQSRFAISYLWEFGDGNMSGIASPSYTYFQPGTYTVRLTAIGSNGQSSVIKVDSVRVYASANASFDVRPNRVTVPTQSAQFINLSTEADRWTWDFGDGNTSIEEFPSHAYAVAGEYTPVLIANNRFNCPDTFIYPLPVIAEVSGSATFPNAFFPDPNGPNEGFYEPGTLSNSIFFPIVSGVTEYHLMIFNRWGEMVFETFDYRQGWDGYYRGEICNQDAYVWKAEMTYSDGREETKVGDVTLLR